MPSTNTPPPPTPPERPARGPRAHAHVSLNDWADVRLAQPPREAEVVRRIALAEIAASAFNPRTSFDQIDELAASLDAHGLLQPIVVRPVDEAHPLPGIRYEIVAGHRRTLAARQLGWREIPALI